MWGRALVQFQPALKKPAGRTWRLNRALDNRSSKHTRTDLVPRVEGLPPIHGPFLDQAFSLFHIVDDAA
jgi:hypothetical protein